MNEIEVKINGLSNPLNVDLKEPIHITWSTVSYWKNYELFITDEDGVDVYTVAQENFSHPHHYFTLEKSEIRKKYNVHLILSNGKNSIEHTGYFFSQNTAFFKADWITRLDNPLEKERMFFREKNNIVLKKEINLNDLPEYSILDVSGLGYYTLHINDKRVGDSYLSTDVTNYGKTIFYDTLNIKDYLIKGINKIEIHLGNGWYNPAPLGILGKYNVRKQLTVGRPSLKMLLEIKEANGKIIEIVSDESWTSKIGNLLYNDVYVGEIFDDEKEINVNNKTVKIKGPRGKLVPSFIPKIKRKEKIIPIKIAKTPIMEVFDVGRVITGQVELIVPSEYKGEIALYYAENIDENNELDFSSTISGLYSLSDPAASVDRDDKIIQRDVIRKNKEGNLHYGNEFTYHSFRYVGIEYSNAKTNVELSAYPTYTDVKSIATFDSSSKELNDIWRSGINTRLNNIHSYFEDCSRERFGYGGDIVALLESHLVTSDVEMLLKKVLNDFADDQRKDGGITQTAPYIGIMTNGPSDGSGSLGWQLVFPVLANKIISKFDDSKYVQKFENHFEKHINYLLSFSFDYVRLCGLGDWGSVNESATSDGVISSPDQEFCTSSLYLLMLQEYLNLAESLSLNKELIKKIEKTIVATKESLINMYYHQDGYFASGSQSSYIFAIKANLYKEKNDILVENLIKKIEEENNTFTFGIFGMAWAYQILPEYGYNSLIYKWLLKEEYPSYISMLSNGNLSLSEHFPTEKRRHTSSSNHAMFSSYSYWLIAELVGIHEQVDDKKHAVRICPDFNNDLDFINGSLLTKYGLVKVSWERQDETINLDIVIPLDLEVDINLKNVDVKREEKKESLANNQTRYTYIIHQ